MIRQPLPIKTVPIEPLPTPIVPLVPPPEPILPPPPVQGPIEPVEYEPPLAEEGLVGIGEPILEEHSTIVPVVRKRILVKRKRIEKSTITKEKQTSAIV